MSTHAQKEPRSPNASGGSVTNVYLTANAARRFASAIQYAPGQVSAGAQKIAKLLPLDSRGHLDLLDIGAGTGAFTLPFAKSLLDLGLEFKVLALDISPQMLVGLASGLQLPQYRNLKNRFSLWEHDAEKGLSDRCSSGSVDIAVFTFVAHYLADLPRMLGEITRVIRKGGLLVQAEITGAMRYVDGTFDPAITAPEAHFRDFWTQYFAYRDKIAPWESTLRVTNIQPVLAALKEAETFHLESQFDVSWSSLLNYASFLEWINHGFLSSLGSGLTSQDRAELAVTMEKWCISNRISLDDKFDVPWGIRVYVNRRT